MALPCLVLDPAQSGLDRRYHRQATMGLERPRALARTSVKLLSPCPRGFGEGRGRVRGGIQVREHLGHSIA